MCIWEIILWKDIKEQQVNTMLELMLRYSVITVLWSSDTWVNSQGRTETEMKLNSAPVRDTTKFSNLHIDPNIWRNVCVLTQISDKQKLK